MSEIAWCFILFLSGSIVNMFELRFVSESICLPGEAIFSVGNLQVLSMFI